MSERNTYLFLAITHGITAASCVGLCLYRLSKSTKPTTLLVLNILNAILWPVSFAIFLCRYLRARNTAGTAEEPAP